MAASKKGGGKSAASEPKQVRKSVTLDPDKLAKARELLGVSSDAEVLRLREALLDPAFFGGADEVGDRDVRRVEIVQQSLQLLHEISREHRRQSSAPPARHDRHVTAPAVRRPTQFSQLVEAINR